MRILILLLLVVTVPVLSGCGLKKELKNPENPKTYRQKDYQRL